MPGRAKARVNDVPVEHPRSSPDSRVLSDLRSDLLSRMRFVAAFTWFYGYSSVRRGAWFVVSYLSLPLSLLFFIYVISHGQYLDYGILGGLLGIMSGNELAAVGDFVFLKTQLKVQDLLVASKIGPADYMAALAASNFMFSLPGLLLYLVIGFLVGMLTWVNIWGILLLMMALVLTSASLAAMIASRISHVRNVWGISSLLSVVLTVLPPLYYPYSALPKPVLYALMLSPSTPVSVVSQAYLGLGQYDPLALLALGIELVAFPVLALKFMRWTDRRKSPSTLIRMEEEQKPAPQVTFVEGLPPTPANFSPRDRTCDFRSQNGISRPCFMSRLFWPWQPRDPQQKSARLVPRHFHGSALPVPLSQS